MSVERLISVAIYIIYWIGAFSDWLMIEYHQSVLNSIYNCELFFFLIFELGLNDSAFDEIYGDHYSADR